MPIIINRIYDANINRISEGLRVIEEYTRFIANNQKLTADLSSLRKKINATEKDPIQNLNARDSEYDVRSNEIPAKRKDLTQILKANFKRVEEALRVLEEYTGLPVYTQYRYQTYELEKQIMLTLLKKPIGKGIYLISDQVDILLNGISQNVAVIQLRDKKSTKKDILKKAQSIQKHLKDTPIPFIINDYIDIAILVDADGLHTGQDDLPIAQIRKILGPHKIIGRTTHNLHQGRLAQTQGADYVSVGPIWKTPSKPNRKAIGLDYLSQASSHLQIPYVAIGGMNLDTIDAILPYNPPLIGLIRANQNIPELQKKILDTPN